MARTRTRRTEEPFQMAPMIDMVFLLLVFFMTVSTLAKDARPELELPRSRTASIPEASPPKDIITLKQEDGDFSYYWSNQKMTVVELEERIRNRKQQASEQIVVRGEPDLPWEFCKELMQTLRESGISDIVFATFEE